MSNLKQIRTALISVYYKDRLEQIVNILSELGVKILSTGGTKQFIEDRGFVVQTVEDLTTYPSILGGRVKTLHPKVFGGILARRQENNDLLQLKQYGIPEIDMVIVDLYPFEETVDSGASDQEIVEKIDIGGISLIRAAAKNFRDVLVVSSRDQYEGIINILREKGGFTSMEDRMDYACEAFRVCMRYDAAIFNYFDRATQSTLIHMVSPSRKLRYGENPHQEGYFYGKFEDIFEQIHGKEISYNNLLDIDAAINLISDFDEPSIAILKHNNACGLASRSMLKDAWEAALAGDPVSAFGGVIISNMAIDLDTAVEINKLFFEAIIAPAYDDEGLKLLRQKKNRIILINKSVKLQDRLSRTILNGIIVQDRDRYTETENDLKTVTLAGPSGEEIKDLLFANKIVKHSKSNAIVIAKNRQLIASGVGQTSRIDAVRHSIEKAKSFSFDLNGAVLASDAYFPFPDSVEVAFKEGIRSVIQPGGSVRDQDSIDFCNKNNMSMVFTGIRHFKH